MSITSTPEYAKMLDTIRILDGHYNKVASAARRKQLDALFRGDAATANQYKTKLRNLSTKHEELLELISDQITSPEQLQETRRALRAAADKAYAFLQQLQKVEMTLETFSKTIGFLEQLTKDIRAIV